MFASAAGRLTVLLLAGLSAAVAANAAPAASNPPPKFVGPTIEHPSIAPDFALRDQRGRVVHLSRERGKVVMITFLYTHCPDACPLTAMHINDTLGSLGTLRKNVVVLAISVDPRGDTPSAVGTFIRSHRLRPQFRYLTGSTKALERVWRLYNVSSVYGGGHDVDHTLYTLVLDRSGKSRVLFDSLAKPAAMEHDVRLLLA
jgi:protein SCO1